MNQPDDDAFVDAIIEELKKEKDTIKEIVERAKETLRKQAEEEEKNE